MAHTLDSVAIALGAAGIVIYLAFAAILAATVFCCIKFPKSSIMVAIFLIIGARSYFDHWNFERKLGYVPEALMVQKILYASEDSWGGGPGGNETGLIVYELPSDVADEIGRSGIDYLTNMRRSIDPKRDRKNYYPLWRHTPVESNDIWVPQNQVNQKNHPSVRHFLDKYGFMIPIDPEIEQQIDSALTSTGSFYGANRKGVMIVMPRAKRVAFIYRG